MAAIYLRHPKHGAKVATSDMEAAYDKQSGWVVFDPNEPEAPVANAMVDDPPAPRPRPKRTIQRLKGPPDGDGS